MSESAIQVEKLSKRFRIGRLNQHNSVRDALSAALKAPFRRHAEAEGTTLWALQDVSFEVKEGEVVGLIGRNGAGKSTLLKILARITRPTNGSALVRGRIASLLEVGTGFHHELTGRENVFLAGAVLGMKKVEIQRKFDEIVAFSEVERFLDTPLKHYSSGMQTRLAFAVAAHLEPEILLVDEVLAVGDASFQKKCLGKMKDVAHNGRTIVFVSHAMAAVNALCRRAIMLRHGSIALDGPSDEVTAAYHIGALEKIDGDGGLISAARTGTGKARFASVAIQPFDSKGRTLELARPGCDLNFEIGIECGTDFAPANLAIIIWDSNGYRVVDTNTAQKGEFITMRSGQSARAHFRLREVLLKPGRYIIGLWLGREAMEIIDYVEHAAYLDVTEGEESSRNVFVFPGVYLCRFENSFRIE